MTVSDLPFDEDRKYTSIMLNDSYTPAEKHAKLTAYAKRVLEITEHKNAILRNLNKLILGETKRLDLMTEVTSLLYEKRVCLVELADSEALTLNTRLLQVLAESVNECKKEKSEFQEEFDKTNADVAVCTEAVKAITTFLSTLET